MARIGIEWYNDYHKTANKLKSSERSAVGFGHTLSGTKVYERQGGEEKENSTQKELGAELGLNKQKTTVIDILYSVGHGNKHGLLKNTSSQKPTNDQETDETTQVETTSMKWWIVDAGEILQSEGIFERWGNADFFGRLHYILGFHSVCSESDDRGQRFARHLENGENMRWAWIRACAETESGNVSCAYLRAENQASDTLNDHWIGKGHVSPDPVCPSILIHLRTTL